MIDKAREARVGKRGIDVIHMRYKGLNAPKDQLDGLLERFLKGLREAQ